MPSAAALAQAHLAFLSVLVGVVFCAAPALAGTQATPELSDAEGDECTVYAATGECAPLPWPWAPATDITGTWWDAESDTTVNATIALADLASLDERIDEGTFGVYKCQIRFEVVGNGTFMILVQRDDVFWFARLARFVPDTSAQNAWTGTGAMEWTELDFVTDFDASRIMVTVPREGVGALAYGAQITHLAAACDDSTVGPITDWAPDDSRTSATGLSDTTYVFSTGVGAPPPSGNTTTGPAVTTSPTPTTSAPTTTDESTTPSSTTAPTLGLNETASSTTTEAKKSPPVGLAVLIGFIAACGYASRRR